MMGRIRISKKAKVGLTLVLVVSIFFILLWFLLPNLGGDKGRRNNDSQNEVVDRFEEDKNLFFSMVNDGDYVGADALISELISRANGELEKADLYLVRASYYARRNMQDEAISDINMSIRIDKAREFSSTLYKAEMLDSFKRIKERNIELRKLRDMMKQDKYKGELRAALFIESLEQSGGIDV